LRRIDEGENPSKVIAEAVLTAAYGWRRERGRERTQGSNVKEIGRARLAVERAVMARKRPPLDRRFPDLG
jgi:hypothetical protein